MRRVQSDSINEAGENFQKLQRSKIFYRILVFFRVFDNGSISSSQYNTILQDLTVVIFKTLIAVNVYFFFNGNPAEDVDVEMLVLSRIL